MGRNSKGYDVRTTLRMTDLAAAIVAKTIDTMGKRGVTMSANDAVNFLIERGSFDDPLTSEDARTAIERHWRSCPKGCSSDRLPAQCGIGAHLLNAYRRVAAFELDHDETPPALLDAAWADAARVSGPDAGSTT